MAESPFAQLQQQAGNQAVQQLLRAGAVQAKLAVSHPDDPDEREADATADRIMRSHAGASVAATSCSCGEGEDETCDACRKSGQKPAGVPSIQRRANGNAGGNGRVAGAGREAPPIVHLPLRSPGQPLDVATRRSMEGSFGADFSRVRVHTGHEAAQSAKSIDARAYTMGQHIVFDAGRYAPDSSDGKRLLAHELVHTLQQDPQAPGPVQADFNTDFAGRSQAAVSDSTVRPPGTIRVKNAAGEDVWAPYGIYTPQEIPTDYQDRIMESGKAFQWRNPELPPGVAAAIETARGGNAGELTVADMRQLSVGAGSKMNIRIMMAHVDNDFRFVGYDMSVSMGSVVGQGFVESEAGTGGVGRALFADRVVRALQSGSSEMMLEVYTTQRTEDFHQQIGRTAGLDKELTEGTKYQLDTREMVRIVLAWSEALSDAQRVQLAPLASGHDEPTPSQVQDILRAVPAGSGTPAASGGFTSGSLDDMRRFGEAVNRNVRRPLEVERLEQLRDSETAEKIINEHAGFASLGGRLYRIQREGEGTRISEVTTSLVWQRVGSPAAPTPSPTETTGPRPVNLDPARTVQVGGEQLEGPAAPTVSAGDVVVINSQQTFEARDAKTGRPLIGMFEGGEWFRILGPDGNNRTVEALTGEGARPIEVGGQMVLAEPFEPEPMATPGGGAGGGVAGGVVAAGGIIMVANEILGPIGAALQNQRATIRAGEAEIDFWTALGANPKYGMWDVFAQAPAAVGTKSDTAVFGTWYFPYIADIDADRLRAELPQRVHNYYELQLLLYSATNFGAMRQENNRWYATVNRPARGVQRIYDITDAIATIQGRTLDTADTALRNRFLARPASERTGRLFRIPTGTTLYRSQGGLLRSQPLLGAGQFLGSNALVREIRRTDYLISTDMVFVEPVNSDAYQAVAFAQYSVAGNIEDVWKEVKKGGREVIPAELPSFGDGPLNSFRAGPETTGDKRFGWENYTPDPEIPGSWTIARGEVRAFWVSSKAIQPVGDGAALSQ